MKESVFVDKDIIYDVLSQRQPFYQSAARLFTLADENKVEIKVSALSIANIHYLLSKQLSSESAKQILRKFKILVTVVQIDDKIIDLALNSNFTDFGDAVQYYCALENNCTILLTRNLKDYKKAQITVMTAQDFINL